VKAGSVVWVTRPHPGSEATARALRDSGYPVAAVPLIETRPVVPNPPPGDGAPDWVVFVSATAVRALEAALGEALSSRFERGSIRAAVVGRRTAETAAALGWKVDLVPARENAAGLLEAFAAEGLAGKTVWIPGGNRAGSATRELPEALAAAGARVLAFQVYETADRRLSPEDLRELGAGEPGAVIFHSPSAAEALYAAPVGRVFPEGDPGAARAWRERAVPVAIGPVTARRLDELGAAGVLTCAEPSDEAIIAVLETAGGPGGTCRPRGKA